MSSSTSAAARSGTHGASCSSATNRMAPVQPEASAAVREDERRNGFQVLRRGRAQAAGAGSR